MDRGQISEGSVACSVLEKVVNKRQVKMTTIKRYSEAFKRKVIDEIENGKYNQN
ncbi:hypothetical protein LEP1GSC013_0006, partial [Leptospira interrogans serovar Valbuzzi str. Duyster]